MMFANVGHTRLILIATFVIGYLIRLFPAEQYHEPAAWLMFPGALAFVLWVTGKFVRAFD